MAGLRLFEPTPLSNPFDTTLRRFVAPLRSERYYGSVSRSFTLAQDVDESKAVAKYQDGVLSLELPKKATTEA